MYCSREIKRDHIRIFFYASAMKVFDIILAIFSRNIMLRMSSLDHICDSMKDVSLAKRTYALARTLLTLSFYKIDFGTSVKVEPF